MKILNFLIILSLFLFACQSERKYIYVNYNTYDELIFNKDGRFIERISLNHQKDTLYGTWKKENNILSLHITQPKVFFEEDSSATVEELVNSKKDSIFFKIFVDGKDSLIFAHIFFNGNYRDAIASTDTCGNASIKKQRLESFAIANLYGSSVYHWITNSNANYFKVFMHSKGVMPEKITRINPTISYLIKGNRIIPLNYDGTTRNDFCLVKKRFWRNYKHWIYCN